ncbi:MAG: Zn-ribbon domain-containing OB-fold protein [archaeon]|mgnify:CR=1 FL=1|jgi:hypothetical protein|nr:transcriptional regulator [Euryarchaeota archaeon]MDP6704143.1 Zn-ribbon domain-containing OB-fold protein [archaeon]|tara:strand:- start:32528 stop:32920 length:393 start_codon:yes stop_codon:yes gene_type:complete
MSVSRFWREIPVRYNLTGGKCTGCNLINVPRRERCKDCGESDFEASKLSGFGKILTYTKIHAAAEGFEHETPYYLAIIELEEGPRLTAQIVDAHKGEVNIGAEVESCFRKISEDGKAGAISYGYKFRPRK